MTGSVFEFAESIAVGTGDQKIYKPVYLCTACCGRAPRYRATIGSVFFHGLLRGLTVGDFVLTAHLVPLQIGPTPGKVIAELEKRRLEPISAYPTRLNDRRRRLSSCQNSCTDSQE